MRTEIETIKTNRTYRHFLLDNFTDEKHCHICGIKFESTDEIWNVEGIVMIDYATGSVKPVFIVQMHLDCCLKKAVLH